MNMKDMIQRMTDLENGAKKQLNESAVAECGTMPAMPPANPGSPVSMNISLNASGKEHVEDLINMMKNAGMSGAQEVMPAMMPMRMDMERLRDVVDGPRIPGDGADNRPREEYMDAEELMAGGNDLHSEKHPADIRVKDPSGYESISEEDDNKAEAIRAWAKKYSQYKGGNGDPLPMGWVKMQLDTGVPSDAYENNEYEAAIEKFGADAVDSEEPQVMAAMPITRAMIKDLAKIFGGPVGEEEAEVVDQIINTEMEGYNNEPDEQYDDHETMIHDLSGGINREKKMYKKAADGDSDMAVESIKDQLYAMLSEKKAKPDFLDIDGDGDTKEPMKKAIKDKKKGAVGKKKTNESYEMGDNDAQDMQYFNAIAALYGPDIWDNDAMADLAQDLADANPSAQDLAYIINKKRLPKHLANIKFSSGDQVQFGEASINKK